MRNGPVLLALFLSAFAACHASVEVGAPEEGDAFQRTDLVSDREDGNLVNPWGMAFGPNTYIWVANAGTGTATVYDDSGNAAPPREPIVVSLPLPAGSELDRSAPTGIVYNSTLGFPMDEEGMPAEFIMATEEGTIVGWAYDYDEQNAVILVDRSAEGASYKGLALADGRLYATNFHEGTVEVFDDQLRLTDLGLGAFSDPELPAGFAPFGIHHVDGDIYVTYAKQDEERADEVAGPGLGFVDQFDTDGMLIRIFATKGDLNAPWAVVEAPAGLGGISGKILVGNFGDGRINSFFPDTGLDVSEPMLDRDGDPIEIEGLWALAFGNGTYAGDTGTLFYTAGPDDEEHGLFGRIIHGQ